MNHGQFHTSTKILPSMRPVTCDYEPYAYTLQMLRTMLQTMSPKNYESTSNMPRGFRTDKLSSRDGDTRGVHHRNGADSHQRDITPLRRPRPRYALVMQEGRVDVHQRNAGKGPQKSHKLVQVCGSKVRNHAAQDDEHRAERVLLPLCRRVSLS